MHQPNGPEFRTTRISTGPRLHYAEQGDPRGESILFLHGFADSWFSFSRVLPLLSPDYRALALDQRGHGDSERPNCCYTVDDFAADVGAFMDAVGIDRATLVGHSSGGMVAQRVALNYPRIVGRLVLVGSPATLLNNEALTELGAQILALEDPIAPAFVGEFQSGTIHHPVPEEFLAAVVSESLKLPARVWRDYWTGVVLAVDHRGRLGEIDAPTLTLWGERDGLLPREEQERMATEMPHATLTLYPETGHAVHWERPEPFVRDLEAFMRDTASAEPSLRDR